MGHDAHLLGFGIGDFGDCFDQIEERKLRLRLHLGLLTRAPEGQRTNRSSP
jgi:hypothetical protein